MFWHWANAVICSFFLFLNIKTYTLTKRGIFFVAAQAILTAMVISVLVIKLNTEG